MTPALQRLRHYPTAPGWAMATASERVRSTGPMGPSYRLKELVTRRRAVRLRRFQPGCLGTGTGTGAVLRRTCPTEAIKIESSYPSFCTTSAGSHTGSL